jgi:hypothetical protein
MLRSSDRRSSTALGRASTKWTGRDLAAEKYARRKRVDEES